MSNSFPESPASPQYPQQQAGYPPASAQFAPSGPYSANPEQYQAPGRGAAAGAVFAQRPAVLSAARPRPAAAIAWFMGLFVFAFYPGIGAIIASVIMIAIGLSCRKDPEPARTNGTAAASWGINYLLATMLLLGSFLYYVIAVLPGDDSDDFLPWGLLLVIWLLISLFHVIISIAFGVRAGRGKVVPFRGIPFIK